MGFCLILECLFVEKCKWVDVIFVAEVWKTKK